MFFLDLPNIGTVRGKYNKIVDNLENITYWLMKIKKICNLTLQIAQPDKNSESINQPFYLTSL